MRYEPRRYRGAVSAAGLTRFDVSVAETDLQVLATRELTDATTAAIVDVRRPLEDYIAAHPRFAESYVPVPVEPGAAEIVRAMASAGAAAGVGPMAAVAGAVAQRVAERLAASSSEVIVENGGDVYLIGDADRTVGVWAGEHGAHGLGLRLAAELMPCAVATSSGRVGHSTSFGHADAVTVIAADGALADAVATAAANRVHGAHYVERGVDYARSVEGVLGVVATADGVIAAWGAVEIVPVSAELA